MSLLPPQKLERLESEFGILHLVYHRSHNQHRVAVWWRHFNLIHRKVRHLLSHLYEMENTRQIKKREALRRQVCSLAAYLVHKNIMKKALYEFHSIIALGHFVNLGLVLVGSVSAIYAILMEIEGVRDIMPVKKVLEPVAAVYDDDVGEEIDAIETMIEERELEDEKERNTESPVLDMKVLAKLSGKRERSDIDSIFDKPKKHKNKEKRKEKKDKKKKKKNAIDDIFG